MRIDVEKLKEQIELLQNNLDGRCCSAYVMIGHVDGAWFKLEAIDEQEAEDQGCDVLLSKNECFLSE